MSQKRTPLAIVGIGCRMPGGIENPDQLWEMISAGKDGYCEVPADRWDWRRYYSDDRDVPGKIYVRQGAFLKHDITKFDPEFFGISPREAMSLDPQQRLLLETSWEAIDDAGLRLDRLAGSRTGVYIGALTLDNMLTQMSTENCENIGAHSAASSTMTMLSNRLSYFLDVHGPSFSVDTACSSSLVAFHLACQGLWNSECDMALVGAVNVMFRPEYMVAMCKGGFLAPDGRSKSFDERANGYGRGEGAGVLVVKPFDRAVQEGDRIYAVVRGTGCNQDGRTNGITVPNPAAQKALIRSVLENTGIPASKIQYIEAHGTGTPVGDPIEARAIGEALGDLRKNGPKLLMGSVKANLGHLEAASGVAGLIKLCMCYKYGAIPPVANLGESNPNIPFEELGLELPRTLEPLKQDGEPVYLAINSFGYGGTNAHVILENPPSAKVDASENNRPLALLPVSGRSEAALRAMVTRHREMLAARSAEWRTVCAAAGLRRTHHKFRAAFAGANCEELIQAMDAWLESAGTGQKIKRFEGQAAKPVFVFSGMGPQWWGMGQQLFQREPVFAEFLRKADAEFSKVSGWSILEEMQRTKETSRINQTIYAQPAIFILQAGLLHLLKSWGVHPTAVLGHSLGENASAYAAEVLTLEQALFVGYHRSQILARAAGLGGGMLAVGLSEEEALSLIAPYGDRVTIAAVNAPKNVTLAGESEALAEVASRLQVKSVFHRALKVEVAYHSAFMNPLQQPLIDVLSDVEPSAPAIDIYSTVTGAPVKERAYDGPYWARNIRQSVQFLRALEAAIGDGHKLFLEVGAHPALGPSIREYIARSQADAEVIATLVRDTDECKTLYNSLASLYAAGCDLDWAAINGGSAQMVALPAYAWQRETYWEETVSALEQRVGGAAAGLHGKRLDQHEPVWERQLNNKYLPFVDHHVVQKLMLLPGAAFVDAALCLQKETGEEAAVLSVEDLRFVQPLVLDPNDDVMLRSVLDTKTRRVAFYGRARQQSSWTRHADVRLTSKLMARPGQLDMDGMRRRMRGLDVGEFYARLSNIGLQYGESFRRIVELKVDGREVLAKLESIVAPEGYDIEHVLHPAVLDSAFQSLMAVIGEGDDAYVPSSIERVVVFGEMQAETWCHGRLTRQDDDALAGDITLLDEAGRVIAMVSGLRCARIARATAGASALLEQRLFRPVWHETTLQAEKSRVGAWMVIAEDDFREGGFGSQLVAALRREGCESVITSAASGAVQMPDGLAGLAYVTCDGGDNPNDAMDRTVRLLRLFQQLPPNAAGLRAYMITERAQSVERGDMVSGFLQASAAGFFRVAHNEFPGLVCTVVDHDGDPLTAGDIALELLADNEADEVAWRAGIRYTQRMEACTLLELEKGNIERRGVRPVDGGVYTLARTGSGLAATGDARRDILYWKHSASRELAADEVEIEVGYWRAEEAATRSAWREFSGRVARTGESVTLWKSGDAVAAAAFCEMSSHVVVRQAELRAIHLRTAPTMEAASLAITGASVDVALRQMARAAAGETVLVVGGTGDDAAQMFSVAAKDAGLRVVRVGDGAALDLRDGALEQRVLSANAGLPVNIVVFCEKVDPALHNRIPVQFGARVVLYGEAADVVDASRFVASETMYAQYRVYPLALAAANAPIYCAALAHLGSLPRHSVSGPQRVCSADELPREAAESGAGMRGLTVNMSGLREVAPANVGEAIIDPQAAYLITGGFGGFGLAVSDYLISQGARQVVLVGRSGATTEVARQRISQWRAKGVQIREALLDITNREAADALFRELAAECQVKGIVHAAGVVDDVRIQDMTREQVLRVMWPKVQGAWNLHVCSLRYKLELDHFVLFSSVASLVGNGGQANYVAANAVLDQLAAYRSSRGLVASSINWGALAEVGMANNEDLLRQFQLMGITPFSSDDAMFGLNMVLRFQPVQIGIMDVDWVQWGKFEPAGGKSPRFAHLTGKRGGGASDSMAASLRQLPVQERFEVAELMLAEQVAQTLRTPADRIDSKRALTDMGIDSLMAVELQIAINMTFGVEFSALELTRGFSIQQLTKPLLERMGLSTEAAEQAPAPMAPASDVDLKALFVPPAAAAMAAGQLAN